MNLPFSVAGILPAIAVSLLLSSSALAEKPAHRIGFLFEGSFEKAEIVSQLEGAKKTQLVPAYEWDYGVRLFSKAEWKKRGYEWEDFVAEAKKNADTIAGKLEPDLIRDSRGVIDYAMVTSEDPFLSSVLMSPVFLEKFKETLGDQLHVVMIDRHILYVFPAAGGKLNEYGSAIVEKFKSAELPVSLEIFQVDKNGFRVVGELER